MVDTIVPCEKCDKHFSTRVLRYTKIDGVFKYLCTECRKALKEAK